MTRPAKHTKAAMAQRLETVFKENGYEGASLKMLADATGLSKASLYHHFPKGKSEMAAHVLAQSGAKLQRLVLAPLVGLSGAPGADRLLASLEGTADYYEGDIPICLMNSLLLGEGRVLFGEQIKAAVDAWRKGFTDCLTAENVPRAEAVAWAADAIGRLQGALVLCRAEGGRGPFDDCLAGLQADIRQWIGAD